MNLSSILGFRRINQMAKRQEQPSVYKTQQGDTLNSIAALFQVDVRELAAANILDVPLPVGMDFKLPESKGESDVQPTENADEKKSGDGEQPAESGEVVLDHEPKGVADPTFNCQNCQGEGLVINTLNPEGKSCEVCGGTGKVS